MQTELKLYPEFERILAEEMAADLSGEMKTLYAETLDKIGAEKTIKMILHDKGIQKLDPRDVWPWRYAQRIVERLTIRNKEQNITTGDLLEIFRRFAPSKSETKP